MVETRDTIVAIATPPGRGGIGVVRVSGPGVMLLLPTLIRRELTPRYAQFCKFRDTEDRIIDEGIAIFFPGPASYTGEDVLELHAHGSRASLSLLVDCIIRLGARHARPGEFTERAFHNNKLDLAQAEAVADLVDAVSEQAVRSAVRSLQGEFSARIDALRENLIELRVMVEAALDFPDEDINPAADAGIKTRLLDCLTGLQEIFMRARQGALLREGITAVIVGRPNVGKSTLLNRLAGREAAIVTDIPGTTRDLIEQYILVGGVPLRLIDTAGLRTAKNVVEQEGIRRAREATAQADVVIAIREYGSKPAGEEKQLLDSINNDKHIIILLNKIDLAGVAPAIRQTDDGHQEILVSAKTGAGIDLLRQQLQLIFGINDLREDVYMARRRHLEALERARQAIQHGQQQLEMRCHAELLAEDLRLAHQALGEITGEFVADDLLAEIFSRFCIGK